MKLSITATVELDYSDNNELTGATVEVEGRNLSEELIESFAKHALCMEVGCGEDELDASLELEYTDHQPEVSTVTFGSAA